MKKTYTQKIKASALLCFLAGAAVMSAKAQTQYFQSGAGSWDGSTWSAVGASAGPYTTTWIQGDFAEFQKAGTYTVTAGNTEQNIGIYNDSSTLNLTISGSGNLDVLTAIQGYLSTSGSQTFIDVPITGAGGIAPELSGSIYLNAANTYTGGTALGDSGNTLTYFNNSSAFGTGGITLNRTGNFSTLLGTGGAPLVINNNFSTVAANTGAFTEINFAANASTPVTVNGTWSLGTVNVNIRNAGGGTSPLSLTGAISGTGGLILSANTAGSTITLSGANTFTGTTTLAGTTMATYGGNVNPTVILGANNVLSTSTGLVMYGGNLNMNGYNTSINGGLTLNVSSGINFLSGHEQLTIGNSSPTWTAGQTLALTGYAMIAGTGQSDGAFYVGVGGLTTAQLAEITIDGESGAYITQAGDALGAGYVEVPEPSTLAIGAMGGLGMLWMIKRRRVA